VSPDLVTQTCNCAVGWGGPTCTVVNPFGNNFYSIKSTAAFSVPTSSFPSQSLAANPPFATMDWTVALMFIPNMSTTNPANVQLILCGPNGYCSEATMNYGVESGLSGCSILNSPQIYDNQTTVWGQSTVSCTQTSWTAFGLAYSKGAQGNGECYKSCSTSAYTGTYIPDPFAVTFQMGNAAAVGQWSLTVYDTNSRTETVNSWELRFYREFHFLFLLIFPSFHLFCL